MSIQEEMMNSNLLLLPVLPTDITIDIFSRLSVDSVLSCKRVCKTWRALIDDDPFFAQAHTYRLLLDDEKQQQQKPEAFEFFLFIGDTDFDNYNFGDTDFDNYNFGEHTHGDITFKLHKSITHDYPFSLPFKSSSNNDCSRRHWIPVNSCNGLICLVSKVEDDYYNSYICVYNPLTREYANLPILTYEQPLVRSENSPYILTDFGYNPCTKEYKVVQIYYKINDNYNDNDDESFILLQGQISVYTIGSECSTGWRSKGETDFKLFGISVLVNGSLHWLNLKYFKSKANKRMEIIAFDLAEEKLRIVPSPPSTIFPPQPSPVHHSALGVLEGRCLCVMISTAINEKLCSMWVMNQDYSSWTKKYNISLNEPFKCLFHYRPLAQSKGGKILLLDYNQMKIVSSDLKNTSFDDVHVISLSKTQLNDPCPRHYYQIFPYTKSFVSLKALGEDGARTGRIKGFRMNNISYDLK